MEASYAVKHSLVFQNKGFSSGDIDIEVDTTSDDKIIYVYEKLAVKANQLMISRLGTKRTVLIFANIVENIDTVIDIVKQFYPDLFNKRPSYQEKIFKSVKKYTLYIVDTDPQNALNNQENFNLTTEIIANNNNLNYELAMEKLKVIEVNN